VDPHWPVVDQVSCLYAEQYLPRQCVPSLAQLRSRTEVRLPFLDRDYVEAVLELPPRERLTSAAHRRLLRATNPALLAITNANTLAWAGAPELVQRASRKGFQILAQLFGYEPYRHYVDPAGWLRGPLYEPVRAILLDGAAASGGFFVPAAVRELLEAHRRGRADHSALLLQMAYVELWRRIFLEREGVTR
jgi:asparagine synthetase B (glutamine-hydrolysing)